MRFLRRPPVERSDDEAFEDAVRQAALLVSSAVVDYDPAGEVVLSGMRLAGRVDLRNVRQLARAQPREEWPELVAQHFVGLGTRLIRPRGYGELEAVRPLLRSRFYGEAELALADDVTRAWAPGVVEALVLAEGSLLRTVPRRLLEQWQADPAELLALGREQVRAQGRLEARTVDLQGAQLLALEGASFFTTTHVCWLADYLDLPPAGVLVALPTRHLLLAHPVHDRSALLAAEAMLVNADHFHEQGPGPVSPHLYWLRAGRPLLLPGQVDGERVRLRPPGEFLDVLRELR